MSHAPNFSTSQLIAFSRLFSARVLQEIGKMGKSPLFSRLVKEGELSSYLSSSATVANAFEAAFHALQTCTRRDEYIYKAALTQRILLGKHSLNTASLLSEFRIGTCKADLVILNGTATVYEIKSERDSLSRLNHQLEAYSKVFAKTYVIAAEKFTADILKQAPIEVGILSLSQNSHVKTIREAVDCADRVCPTTLLGSLRTPEAINVAVGLGWHTPDVPNTVIRQHLLEFFATTEPARLHHETVKVLKKTRSQASLQEHILDLPPSLIAAALTTSLTKAQRKNLAQTLCSPLCNAMAWS